MNRNISVRDAIIFLVFLPLFAGGWLLVTFVLGITIGGLELTSLGGSGQTNNQPWVWIAIIIWSIVWLYIGFRLTKMIFKKNSDTTINNQTKTKL